MSKFITIESTAEVITSKLEIPEGTIYRTITYDPENGGVPGVALLFVAKKEKLHR